MSMGLTRPISGKGKEKGVPGGVKPFATQNKGRFF